MKVYWFASDIDNTPYMTRPMLDHIKLTPTLFDDFQRMYKGGDDEKVGLPEAILCPSECIRGACGVCRRDLITGFREDVVSYHSTVG